MRRFVIIAILLILSGLVIFTSYMLYSEKIMVQLPVLVQKKPKITFILGDAFYRESSVSQWEMAIVGQELSSGYEVKTTENTQVDIRFNENTAIRVSENTIIKIDEMTIKKLLLKMERGSMYGKFEKIFKDHSMGIKTPTTIAGIRGTELGFQVSKDEQDKKSKKKDKEENLEQFYRTTVYSLSGITELVNPKFRAEKVLLANQKKIVLPENNPPEDSENMTEEEVSEMRSILNSIHTEEVLFISTKINFEIGSATILPSSHEELDKILKILQEKDVNVRIEGHTDIQGSAAFNQTLSVNRALSIKEYFVGRGIKTERLEIAGYGSSKPIADNKTKIGRALNRRVEFIVVE